jgi:hypothetical protein
LTTDVFDPPLDRSRLIYRVTPRERSSFGETPNIDHTACPRVHGLLRLGTTAPPQATPSILALVINSRYSKLSSIAGLASFSPELSEQGISIPCSFPDNSLFGFDLKVHFPALKHSAAWSYLRVGAAERSNSLYFSLLTRRRVRARLRPPPTSLCMVRRDPCAVSIGAAGIAESPLGHVRK